MVINTEFVKASPKSQLKLIPALPVSQCNEHPITNCLIILSQILVTERDAWFAMKLDEKADLHRKANEAKNKCH